jgi:DNA-binding Lrp family transcriptional regulator
MTLIDPLALGYEGVASIGIRCEASKVNQAADLIASHRNVQTVVICTGRYDIIAWVMFRELSDLSDFVTVELSQIPGLQYTETMTNLKIIKTSHKSVGDDTPVTQN